MIDLFDPVDPIDLTLRKIPLDPLDPLDPTLRKNQIEEINRPKILTLYSETENSKLPLLYSFDPNWTLYVCVCIIIPCDYIEHTHNESDHSKKKVWFKTKGTREHKVL